MRIKDKRSGYLLNASIEQWYFMYLDELDDLNSLFNTTFSKSSESYTVYNFGPQSTHRVDADRPIIIFSGTSFGSTPELKISSCRGTALKTIIVGLGEETGSNGRAIAGVSAGDFLSITT